MFVNVETALISLSAGQVIAYPTEGVFGLGCDPFNERALSHLFTLKKRDPEKGLIVLINSLKQLDGLIDRHFEPPLDLLSRYWPGPYTFLFPKCPELSPLITGEHTSIAIRYSSHPIAQALCDNGPIVSTSANLAGQASLMAEEAVAHAFAGKALSIVSGKVGNAKKSSRIIDLKTGDIIRP
jgi:L-threonylcarbamoyladenylate synthase